MEEEKQQKKRWSVTYTKHIKRKRKVYQDGFLHLHIPTNKLMLYDESEEKVLECRKLREDEVVSSDQTLTFSSYLVDVGLLHGSHSESDATAKRDKGRPIINLSPSHRIIREWQVLYTTQLTQKSKKYHDGFLQLLAFGSLGRQVLLFDEQRNLLESRFLKRDVVIRSGESISLDAHLLEIGECNENSIQGNDNSNDGNMGIRHEQKNQFQSDGDLEQDDKKCEVLKFGAGHSPACTIKSTITEWQVMYTTQVTQKAKKYHDGFLQLTNSGTLQRQIMLYDGSKKLINSRFLKKDEVIQSGESITFDAHLVDVGEPEGNYQVLMDSDVCVNNYNVAGKSVLMQRVPNSLKTDKSFLKGKPKKIACSGEYSDPSFSISSINETKISQTISAKKPLRDAIQIISILQKPMMQDSIARGSIHKNIINPVPYSEEPQNSDSPRYIAECKQLPRTSVAHHGSNEKTENRESTKCIGIKKSTDFYSEAKSTCSGNESFKSTEDGKLQPHSDNLEAYSLEIVDVTKNLVEFEITRETGGCPSFDLGLD